MVLEYGFCVRISGYLNGRITMSKTVILDMVTDVITGFVDV